MHEEKVHARAVAILARATGVTLLVPRSGLPANAAQGVALVFEQGVPFVPGRMPELMEQAMLRGRQPGQQRWIQSRALAGFGEHLLDCDKAIVLGRHHQGAIQIQHATTEAAAAGIAETGPDFIQRHAELVVAAASGAEQAPTQLRRLDPGQHRPAPDIAVLRLNASARRCREATQATALWPMSRNSSSPSSGKPSSPASRPSKRICQTPRSVSARRWPATSATSNDASPGVIVGSGFVHWRCP